METDTNTIRAEVIAELRRRLSNATDGDLPALVLRLSLLLDAADARTAAPGQLRLVEAV